MNLLGATTLLVELLTQAAAVSAIVKRAQEEGRDNLTPEEIQQIDDDRRASLERLRQSIARREAEEGGT